MNITGEAVKICRGSGQGPNGADGQMTTIIGTWTPPGSGQSFPVELTVKYSGLNSDAELQYGTHYSVSVAEV